MSWCDHGLSEVWLAALTMLPRSRDMFSRVCSALHKFPAILSAVCSSTVAVRACGCLAKYCTLKKALSLVLPGTCCKTHAGTHRAGALYSTHYGTGTSERWLAWWSLAVCVMLLVTLPTGDRCGRHCSLRTMHCFWLVDRLWVWSCSVYGAANPSKGILMHSCPDSAPGTQGLW